VLLADLTLAGQNVASDAAGSKHGNQIALAQAAIFHQCFERIEWLGVPEIIPLLESFN